MRPAIRNPLKTRDGSEDCPSEPGARCLLAPGDIAWKSDLEVLRQLKKGAPAPASFETAAAKYLVNSGAE